MLGIGFRGLTIGFWAFGFSVELSLLVLPWQEVCVLLLGSADPCQFYIRGLGLS